MSLQEQVRPKAFLTLAIAIAACALFSDAAVDLAACINRAAEEMRDSQSARREVECPVRGNRTVTAALFPDGSSASVPDSQSLRELGLPADAIFYSGPDSPSIGHLVPVGPVYVYDGGYRDNRKYSTTSSLASYIRIARPMAKTGNRFVVDLQRTDTRTVEIVGLH